ncbi:MAG TPA: RidA family protein [Chloroflexi bacterium]|nr:RidA family protein [Chloroflexota bacterium]HPO57979.1 RidA family protein [Anaerolineaceae bacterium]
MDSSQRELFSNTANKLPFSAAVAYQGLVFISGMVGRNPDTGEIALGDPAAQTRQALQNAARALELAGTSLDKALKVTLFVTDMGFFSQVNEAYAPFFPEGLPARTCVEVSALPDRDALVEVELIAGR